MVLPFASLYQKSRAARTLVAFLVAVASCTILPDVVRADQTPPPLTAAEEWVRMQVAAGKEANFASMEAPEEPPILRAVFLEGLLTHAYPGWTVPRQGIRIANAIVNDRVDLHNAEVAPEVMLTHCRFAQSFDLSSSQFKQMLSLIDTTFGGTVYARNARLAGLDLTNARFMVARDESQLPWPFDLEFAQVDNDLTMTGAKFTGPADFAHLQARSVIAGGATFKAQPVTTNPPPYQAAARFDDVKVTGSINISHGEFLGSVSFLRANMAGNFEADGAIFRFHTDRPEFKKPVRSPHFFNSIKVGGIATFSGAKFEGSVDFVGSTIGSQLNLRDATFLDDLHLVLVKVTGEILFNEQNFAKPVFTGTLYLYGTTCADMYVWHGKAGDKETVAAKDNASGLLHIAGIAQYSASVYENIQAVYRHEGEPAMANRAYVDGRRRARQALVAGKHRWAIFRWQNRDQILAWAGNWFLDVTVRYGKSPGRAFLIGLFLVLVGWVLFLPCFGVVRRKDPLSAATGLVVFRWYHSLWFSLDVFLPAVQLKMVDVWMVIDSIDSARPTSRRWRIWRWLAWNYQPLLKVCGWVLIPIGVAAITGFIK